MEPDSSLLVDIAVALSIALAGGWAASRVGLSSIVGYIAAGIVISPFTPGFVGDVDRLRLIAEIGVVLLMFGIGLHFSLGDLARAGVRLTLAAAGQVAGVMAAGVVLGLAAGWGRDQALFAGAAIAISSSTVIVKMLQEEGGINEAHGRLAVDVFSLVVAATAISMALTPGITAATSSGLRRWMGDRQSSNALPLAAGLEAGIAEDAASPNK